jgi:hypothetical protein
VCDGGREGELVRAVQRGCVCNGVCAIARAESDSEMYKCSKFRRHFPYTVHTSDSK